MQSDQAHWLRRDELVRLDGNVAGRVISCREGVLWLTQTGNPGDHLIRQGEAFSIERPGRIVIGALADSVCTVAGQKTGSGFAAGMLMQAIRRWIRRVDGAGRSLWA